jgi:hypothetical protein
MPRSSAPLHHRFTPPTASDACNGATVNQLTDVTVVNGCTKTITRTWDATDACNNHSATVSQVITIVDTTPPVIGAAGGNATIEMHRFTIIHSTNGK